MTRPVPPRSLRTTLILFSAFTMAIVQGAFAFAVYLQVRATLLAEFDAGLHADASALAAIVDVDHRRLSLDQDALRSSSLADTYYEIQAPPDQSLRSANLKNLHLSTFPPGLHDTPVILPNHLTGRAVSLDIDTFQEGDTLSPRLSITLARDDTSLRHTLTAIGAMLLLLCAAAILLSSLLLAILIRFMLRVTDRLSTQLSSLNAADLSRRIHLPDAPREFQPVIDTVNALLARLADAFDRERSFSADVAHELRTPLASLQTTLDVALRRQPNDPANRTALERCHPVVRHMGAIVENLLTISRADAGQLSFIPEPVDLPALLHECWQPFADRAAAHNLHLTWNLTPSHSLPTDPHHLRFILRNLLDNAVTYTPPAGSIAISTASTDSHVELSIQNTGCTLTPQQLDQIFQRFWRADSSRSPTDAHAGLGLSLCRRLATTLHGTLTAHLTDTTFTISLLLPAPVPAPIRTS